MIPSFLQQLQLICQFELKRLFFTRKGLLYLITFLAIWFFILIYPIRYAADLISQSQATSQASLFFQFIGFSSLLNWQVPELGVYWRFALIIFPLLCITISADQTCSDRERGTIRFLCLRLSRNRLFYGRFCAVLVIQSLLIIVTALTTVFLAITRDTQLFATIFSSACAIAINLFLVLLPFTALMATLSMMVTTARQATVWAILIWSFLTGIISGISYYFPPLSLLQILVPGYQLTELSQLSEWQLLTLAYIPILQAIVLLAIGHWTMNRQPL